MSNRRILDFHIIYLVTDGDLYKIGRTTKTSFYKRMRSLQLANPKELKVICAIPSSNIVTEKYIHDKFKHYRVRGEWFRKHPSVVKYFFKRWCKLYFEVGYGCTMEFKLTPCKSVHLMNGRYKKEKRIRKKEVDRIKNQPLMFDNY